MKDNRVVLDASALGALIFREPEAEQIESRILNTICFAPSLIDYEMGSILMKKLKLYPKEEGELREVFNLFYQFPLDRMEVLIEPVIELARTMDLSFYDASYLWMAKEFDAKLVTLDKRLLRASSKLT